MLLFDIPFVRRLLDEHPISQIVSVVGVVTIVWYLYAGEGPLLNRARDIQGAGIFVMLPLGFKAILLYILFCYVYYYAIPPSLVPSNNRRISSAKVPHTAGNSPTKSRVKNPVLPQKAEIELPVEGWSIAVEFSSSRPHVKFLDYKFSFAKELNTNLERYTRSGTVQVEIAVKPTKGSSENSNFVLRCGHGQWDAQFKIIHREHRVIFVYEFALTQVWICLPVAKIPPQLRECRAGGEAWQVDIPKLADFQSLVKRNLAPERCLEDIHIGFPDAGGKQNFDGYIPCVDLTQVHIPIIVPRLTKVSFGTDPLNKGPILAPFRDRTKDFLWDHLTRISLDTVMIFAEEYRRILQVCPELRTLIIRRPGEGFGAPDSMMRPVGLAKASQLRTLHLIDCRVDMSSFLSATVVDLRTVTELVLLCSSEQSRNSLRVEELAIDWTGIRTLKLSERIGREFLAGCRNRLSSQKILSIRFPIRRCSEHTPMGPAIRFEPPRNVLRTGFK
ncbi:hypothetical protein EV359DRAFT_67362 [Lentinula novae-zelandiae]|nr:hypothetical protein EV359DRAFT_67362 [Lentinula novae-zelandiae]